MYYLLILAIGIERLAELIVSKRNARWAFAHDGKEFGRGHTAWLTAAGFTLIRVENAALGYS